MLQKQILNSISGLVEKNGHSTWQVENKPSMMKMVRRCISLPLFLDHCSSAVVLELHWVAASLCAAKSAKKTKMRVEFMTQHRSLTSVNANDLS